MSYSLRDKQSIVAELASAGSVAVDLSLLKESGKKCYLLRDGVTFRTPLEHDQRILFELLDVVDRKAIENNRKKSIKKNARSVRASMPGEEESTPSVDGSTSSVEEPKKKGSQKNIQE